MTTRFYNFDSGEWEEVAPIPHSEPVVGESTYEPKVGDHVKFQKAWRGLYVITGVNEYVVSMDEIGGGFTQRTRMQHAAFYGYLPYPVTVRGGAR
jgi:hypothetical protein